MEAFGQLSLKRLVSMTTRIRGPKEKDGVDYDFVTQKRFNELAASGDIFEKSERSEGWYGMSAQRIDERLIGSDVIKAPDGLGLLATQEEAKKRGWKVVSIFITTDEEILRKRLKARGRNTEEQIERRIELVKKDMEYERFCNYSITSTTPDADFLQVMNIYLWERYKRGMSSPFDNQKPAKAEIETRTEADTREAVAV